jgi:hypothetical protein
MRKRGQSTRAKRHDGAYCRRCGERLGATSSHEDLCHRCRRKWGICQRCGRQLGLLAGSNAECRRCRASRRYPTTGPTLHEFRVLLYLGAFLALAVVALAGLDTFWSLFVAFITMPSVSTLLLLAVIGLLAPWVVLLLAYLVWSILRRGLSRLRNDSRRERNERRRSW